MEVAFGEKVNAMMQVGQLGQFDVLVNDELAYSREETRAFPTVADIKKIIDEKIAK